MENKKWPEDIQAMIDAGFEITFHESDVLRGRTTPDKPPQQESPGFKKGTLHIWKCREGYQVADLINGYYTNHRAGSQIIGRTTDETTDDVIREYSSLGNRTDRYVSGFIPDLKTVLELYNNNDL